MFYNRLCRYSILPVISGQSHLWFSLSFIPNPSSPLLLQHIFRISLHCPLIPITFHHGYHSFSQLITPCPLLAPWAGCAFRKASRSNHSHAQTSQWLLLLPGQRRPCTMWSPYLSDLISSYSLSFTPLQTKQLPCCYSNTPAHTCPRSWALDVSCG